MVAVVAFAVAVLAIWQVFRPLPQGSQYYLIVFLAGTLPLVFLVYRSGLGRLDPEDRPGVLDWALAAITLVVCLYPVLPVRIGSGGGGYDAFLDRQGLLEPIDVAMGALLLVLILEACRRTTGWALPVVCGLFLAYGYYGGLLPQGWAIAHAGLDFDQIVDALYNSGSGFYGTPLDVAATYIVLFTIYGAVLELSGAGRFFVDLSVAAFRRSRSAAGRTAVASGFLLGTVSGSGTAPPPVSIGAVTWPIMRQAGYPPERAGGMLAAAGVGASAVAADARGRGVHRRRVPRTSPTSRCSAGRPSRRSCTTWASCWPWRSTPAGSASARRSRRRIAVEAAGPLRVSLLVVDRDRRAARAGVSVRPGPSSTPPRWPACCPSWTAVTG